MEDLIVFGLAAAGVLLLSSAALLVSLPLGLAVAGVLLLAIAMVYLYVVGVLGPVARRRREPPA